MTNRERAKKIVYGLGVDEISADADDRREAIDFVEAHLDAVEEKGRSGARHHDGCNYYASIYCNKCGWLGPKEQFSTQFGTINIKVEE